ncbi:MAG: DUF3010 family protein [Saprospiraceae bacterium]
MKVIGIAIDKSKANFYVAEQDGYGKIKNLTGDFKFLELKNDTDNASVREFMKMVHNYFDVNQPDRIVILARQTKGRFRASPISFKIETLLQCYEEIEVEFVSSPKLTAFFKKNELDLPLEYNYQENAAKVAFYICSNE